MKQNPRMNPSLKSIHPTPPHLRLAFRMGAVTSLLTVALLTGCGPGANRHAHDHDHDHNGDHTHDHIPVAPPASDVVSAPYTLENCPVSGEELGSMGEPVVYLHEGREIRFCCQSCVKPFQEDPAKYLESVDAAMIEQQMPDYPLQTCVVTGMKLGSMGDPYPYIYRNHLVLFCCDGCIPAFQKDPATHLEKINQARLR